MKRWLLFPVLALVCVPAQADLYRWVDAQGKVQYSDQPPPANIRKVEIVKWAGGKSTDAPWPYALQEAVKNFPVTLYSSECGEACTLARALLAKRGIPYTEMDATDAAAQEELKKLTGGPLEVPVLQVGRDAVRGFEEGRWNTSLDAAGYPKTAVIPPRPPNKPAAAAPPVAPPPEPPAAALPPAEASQ
ncbi:MAG TPA: glutaredoxin family protein [Burkholderiales bacterium]|nr:glutaredoxin family protein [Burkholderiales bacterium]